LFAQGVFYTAQSGAGVVLCRNGNRMTLANSSGRTVWRCNGRNCCGRSQKTARIDSFFYGYKAPLERVLMVVYLFMARLRMYQMRMFTGLNPKTIRSICQGLYYVMEQDLNLDDCMVGK
jgi:hypothetical protein